MKRTKNQSILKKINLVVISSLILTAFMVILAFYSVFFYMKGQIQDSYQRYLGMYAQIVESKLDETSQKGFSIIIDSKIQKRLEEWNRLSKEEPETEAESMDLLYHQLLIKKDIEQILFNNMALTGQIRHLSVITPDGDVLSSSEDSGLNAYPGMEAVIDAAEEQKGGAVWISDLRDSGYIIEARSIRGLKAARSDPSLGTFVMWIDLNKIINMSDDSMPFNDSILLMKDKDSTLMYTNDKTMLDSPISGLKGGERIRLDRKNYLTCVYRSGGQFEYNMLLPADEIYEPVRRFILPLIGLVIFVISMVVLATSKLSRQIMEPIPRLANAMKAVETGHFEINDPQLLEEKREDEIGDLCRDFVLMIQKIDQLVQENYVKQLVIKETELRAMQAQINPHFLYNTLESINCMAMIAGQPDISVMVKSLGNLLRESMSNHEIYHTVDQEMMLIRSYLSIQKIRFEDKLDYRMEAEEQVKQWMIPKFLLQPIVENAVVYGVEATGRPCSISILVKRDENGLRAEICDNGPGMEEETVEAVYQGTVKGKGNGIGLCNIMKRLELFCEGSSRFQIVSRLGEGTSVIIELAQPKEGKNGVESIDRG